MERLVSRISGGHRLPERAWPAYAALMASTWARTRARERIAALGAAGLDDRDLRRQVLAVLREVIDFDAYVWLLTDPVTAVGAAPLAEVPVHHRVAGPDQGQVRHTSQSLDRPAAAGPAGRAAE